jgi:hypothetical protein
MQGDLQDAMGLAGASPCSGYEDNPLSDMQLCFVAFRHPDDWSSRSALRSLRLQRPQMGIESNYACCFPQLKLHRSLGLLHRPMPDPGRQD